MDSAKEKNYEWPVGQRPRSMGTLRVQFNSRSGWHQQPPPGKFHGTVGLREGHNQTKSQNKLQLV
jgi:hypothetical protein